MAFWNKIKTPSKSHQCERLSKELDQHHEEFDEFDKNIRNIQSRRNGRKYITPSRDLDQEDEILTT